MTFVWSPQEARYREDGRLVPEARIRAALDTVLTAQSGHARDLSQQLIDGNLKLASWEAEMRDALRAAHLVGTSLANGGWANLGPSEFGWTGSARIRPQYAYLSAFAQQIASGDQPLDGTVLSRAEMYMQAARGTYQAALARNAQDRGLEEERNNLGGAEAHCGMCPSESMRGWVPIGTLIPVGSRTCLSRCKCHLEFRLAPVVVSVAA